MRFFLLVLAIWRLSRAIAWERGPGDVFAKGRAVVAQRCPYAPAEAANYLGPNDYDNSGRAHSWQRAGVNCPLCISFWLGIVAAALSLLGGRWRKAIDITTLGLALAGGSAWLTKLEKRLNGY